MSTTSKIKWLASIILAGLLLVLAMIGGNWGTNYTASAAVNVAPTITLIRPSAIPAGAGDTVIVISGYNFGTKAITSVRLYREGEVDTTFEPLSVVADGVSVSIPRTYLTVPTEYKVSVITVGTISQESNQLDLKVFEPKLFFLPLIFQNY